MALVPVPGKAPQASVSPCPTGRVTLRDLKRCKLAHVFFDTFFNIEKYLDHEQREQVSLLRVSAASPRAPPPPGHLSAHPPV